MAFAEANYCDQLLRHAAATPGQTALVTDHASLSFADLAWALGGIARGLDQSDVEPGAVVAILTDGNAGTSLAALGSMLGGRATLVLDPGSPDADIARLLSTAGARLLLIDRSIALERAAAIAGPIQTVAIEDLPDGFDPVAVRRPGGDRLAQIAISSGTSGPSKSAPSSHRQLIDRIDARSAPLGLTSADRHRPIVSMNFALGRYPVWRTLNAGGTVAFHPLPQSMPKLIADLTADAISYLATAPTHVTAMLDGLPQQSEPALPAVRVLTVASAMLPLATRKAILSRLTPNLHIGYASNEAGTITHATPADLALNPDTVGRAVETVALRIVDDLDRPLPAGAIGEVCVRSPLVSEHYIGDPAATDRAHRNGWFHMGDTGYLDADGYLFLRGRVDDRINFGGRKLYPIEIEEVLLAHPAVAEAVALAMPSARNQEVPVAAVVLRHPVAANELESHCRAALNDWKVPRDIFVLPELPRTGTRKVKVPELRKILLSHVRARRGRPA